VSLNEGDQGAYAVTLDANGKELTRERLRAGGGLMRVAPAVDPNAPARGAGPGGPGRRGAPGAGAPGGAAAPGAVAAPAGAGAGGAAAPCRQARSCRIWRSRPA